MTVVDTPTPPDMGDETPPGMPPTPTPTTAVSAATAATDRHDAGLLARVPDALVGLGALITAVLVSRQWSHIFADNGATLPTIVAALLGFVVAVLCWTRALSRPAAFLVMVVAGAAGLGALYRSQIGDLPSDLVNSWKGLASSGLLTATEPRFVLVPVVATGLGTWFAADWYFRRRTAGPAVLALAATHAVALAYTVSQHRPSALAVGLMAAAFGLVMAAAGLSRPGGADFDAGIASVSPRQLAAAGAAVVALAAVAGGASTLLDQRDDQAFDLRDRLERPLDIKEASTPLARLKTGLIDADRTPMFTIGLTGLGPDDSVELLPVATLDRYDGSIWTTATVFTLAGTVLPEPTEAPPTADTVRQNITLADRYPFRFLPTAGVVRSTQASSDLAWDDRLGTLAAVDPELRSYQGDVALVRAPDGSPVDPEAPGPVSSRVVEIDDAQRDVLNAYLTEIGVATSDAPEATLLALEDHLRSDAFGYNVNAPAGHSLAALASFLSDAESTAEEVAPASRIGFAEQSASAFAVLARQLGWPSRVVVGYRLDEPLTSENPETAVTAPMIHAWPEVWLEERGWVRFEPTNPLNQTADEAARTPSVSSAGVDSDRTDLPDLEEPLLLPERAPADQPSALRWLALGLVPLLYWAIVHGAKTIRRMRRRRRSGDARVIGAWRETQDRLEELGLPARPSQSALDVSEACTEIDLRDVGETISTLAPTLDIALYSPEQAGRVDGDSAWTAANTAVGHARKASSLGTRLRASLDPRSLLRRD